MTAMPLINKIKSLREDLIAVGAVRYTVISLITCGLISAVILFVVIHFCPLYLLISFFTGAVIALAMLANKLSPANRPMFDAFCSSYCRFIVDDELRTAMYNKKTGQIKSRLKAMEIDGTFIPEFKNK